MSSGNWFSDKDMRKIGKTWPARIASTRMKFILVALLMSISVAAGAASLEESYLAARDGYIEKLKPAETNVDLDEAGRKQEELARGELEQQLRRIIGTPDIKGFSAPGKINLETLFKGYSGFGLLDGLLYSSADDKTHIVVTTDVLLDRWLREHKEWWGPTVANVPQDVNAALKSAAFYTQALTTDAAISKYVELPVAKPAKAKLAFAMLVARSQDLGPRTPDELIVTVVRGGRVFVVSAPANASDRSDAGLPGDLAAGPAKGRRGPRGLRGV